jgi:hypothetical protein
MQKTTKTESPMKYGELVIVAILSFVVAVGLYFTNVKLW